MDHLGHEKVALVGHDRGARVGTRFAKDFRVRVDRFVAMDETSRPGSLRTPTMRLSRGRGTGSSPSSRFPTCLNH
ncbi:alpha/beta fold hydrolase [Streptomyces sp. KL116D]|uniref:alpha/beta fold hydrolase n=1 Tax=Streptomyces sp. KL116D TaxID=3045152 RepID=UPI003556C589